MVSNEQKIFIRESEAWKLLNSIINNRVDELTKNVLTFGTSHDIICFNQGKINALKQLVTFVETDEPEGYENGNWG